MNQDYVDLLQGLLDHKAKFIVVGAYALAIHGRPRATGDLDIWIKISQPNVEKVYAALVDFGAPLDDLTVQDLCVPGTIYQMGFPPNRIDILTKASGLQFVQAWSNRIMAQFGPLEIPVIGIDDMICNKLATGREKDLLDVKELKAIKAQPHL